MGLMEMLVNGLAMYSVGGLHGWTNYNMSSHKVPDFKQWALEQPPFHPGDQFGMIILPLSFPLPFTCIYSYVNKFKFRNKLTHLSTIGKTLLS